MSRSNTNHIATKALTAVPYFAELDPATLETVAQAAIRRDYKACRSCFGPENPAPACVSFKRAGSR